MAITELWFSTTNGPGGSDGTTWDKRAALFSGGNWSTYMTAVNGSSNAARFYIGPGSYTCSQAMASGLFAGAPTAINPFSFEACDSSGNRLTPGTPGWISNQPAFSTSAYPVITSSVKHTPSAYMHFRMLRFEGSSLADDLFTTGGRLDWCYLKNAHSNTAAGGCSNTVVSVTNSVIEMGGANQAAALAFGASGSCYRNNVRLLGACSGAGSGSRVGLLYNGTTIRGFASRIFATGFQKGFYSGSTNVSQMAEILRSMFVGNVDGMAFAATASQTNDFLVSGCVVSGNSGYGINADASWVRVMNSRLRDNTTANFNGVAITDHDNYTTDSDDTTEFQDAANADVTLRDYRIKQSASNVWGKGYGCGDYVTAGGGGCLVRPKLIVT